MSCRDKTKGADGSQPHSEVSDIKLHIIRNSSDHLRNPRKLTCAFILSRSVLYTNSR